MTAPDPLLQAGDMIVVGTSDAKTVFNSVMKVLPLARAFVLF